MIASHTHRVIPLNFNYTLSHNLFTETAVGVYLNKSRPGLDSNVGTLFYSYLLFYCR
jgi:hypothetical protein